MARRAGVFYIDSMIGALIAHEDIEGDALEVFEDRQYDVLAHAQDTAPWDDRTGMARAGLGVEAYAEDGEIYLELYHTVDYGQWLETIQNGRFAVIMPTLEYYSDIIFGEAGGRTVGEEAF